MLQAVAANHGALRENVTNDVTRDVILIYFIKKYGDYDDNELLFGMKYDNTFSRVQQ